MKRLTTPLLALGIFLLNVWLNGPLFMHGELPFRGSIENGYVSITRFIAENPSPWGWDPFQYCGIPTRFLYVPVLPYVTAALSHVLTGVDLAHIYRLIVSLMTCLGPVTLFFFALHFTGSRRWALAAAVGYSIFSPSYGLFPAVEKDRGFVQLPWRVQVLAKYGEGPHNTTLTLMPLALLALWRATRTRGYPSILLAAVLLAVTPLVNWVGAFALALACTLLLLASWGDPKFRIWRAVAAGGLGYALACFWLTPTFIETIVFNWPTDSFAYHFDRPQQYLVGGMILGVLLIRLAFKLAGGSFYFCLMTMAAFVFGWISTFFYLFDLDTIPESRRYAVEFELFFMLALVEALRLTLRLSNSTVRLCAKATAGLLLLAGTPQLWAYASQGWSRWKPVAKEQTIEYRLAQWMADHPPAGRVFASGGLRFRMNSWFDLQQVGGGFETGNRNRMPWDLSLHIRTGKGARAGHDAEDAVLQLKAMNTQYVVIHGPKSREYYRDYVHPERLAALMTPVHHEEDDTIYSLPARPLANLISRDEMAGDDAAAHPEALQAYVTAMEDGTRPILATRWLEPNRLTVEGAMPAERLVAVRVNADSGWHASQDGREIPIEKDKLGFMVLQPAAKAATRIELEYRATTEARVMAAVSALAWLGALISLFIWRKPSDLQTTN